MKKNVLAFLLALCLIASMLPVTAFADQDSEALTKLTVPANFCKPEIPAVEPAGRSYSVSLTGGAKGVTELLVGSSAAAGSEVYFLADPDDGYMAEVYVDGIESGLISYTGLNIWSFYMPDNDVSVEVRYVATLGDSYPVKLNTGEGGKTTLYRNSATESESVFLSVLPDDQSLFHPIRDVVASKGSLHYLYWDDETGEYWYELYMPDWYVTISVSYHGSVPLRIDPIVNLGNENCDIIIEPEKPCFRDEVTVTIKPKMGFRLEKARVCYKNGVQVTGVRDLGDRYTFVMPPRDLDLRIELTQYDYPATYPVTVTVENGLGGSALLGGVNEPYGSVRYIGAGSITTIDCYPSEGYRLAKITGAKDLVDKGNGQYAFTMPEKAVSIDVLFLRNENPFLDVNETHFFYTPVLWAEGEGITSGISAIEFGPNQACNRAQVVTFLWRYAGCPEPTGGSCPFTDVQKGSWYEKAVLWAVEKGITNGVSATEFAPNQTCNRAQVVTFLWRFLRQPVPGLTEHPFTDVQKGSWYEQAVLWAVEKGITTGATATTFDPDGKCQRAQVVTFLYRTGHGKEPSPVPPVGKLTIHTATDTVVHPGETLQLDYTYTGDKSMLDFRSDYTDILTVDDNGMVAGISVGSSRVKVYYGDLLLGRVRLHVEEPLPPEKPRPKAERISASGFTGPYFDGIPGVVGNYMTFKAHGIGYDEEGNVVTQPATISSSDPDVASAKLVKINGVSMFRVKFLSPGMSTITLTSEDGNASAEYTVFVNESYETPIGRRLTPEQFVTCVNSILEENGVRISTSMGWLLMTFSPDELTGETARVVAEDHISACWPSEIRSMGLEYRGMDEDGNHIFYIHR